MSRTATPPLRVRFHDESRSLLALDWRDGHVSVYPTRYLRGWCPCAPCQGHGPVAAWVRGELAAGVAGLKTIGNHALQITWVDGHATGLYTWEWLREACPCEACGGPREGTPAEVAALVPRE